MGIKSERRERRELLLARVVHEQAWAAEQLGRRLSFSQMRQLSALPLSEGGLGVERSEQALKTLVAGYRQRMADLTLDREERIERQGAEQDEMMRALRDDLAQHKAATGRVDKAASAELRAWHASERALYGLDAAQRIEVGITNHDSVTAELNEMLARAGRKPVKRD